MKKLLFIFALIPSVCLSQPYRSGIGLTVDGSDVYFRDSSKRFGVGMIPNTVFSVKSSGAGTHFVYFQNSGLVNIFDFEEAGGTHGVFSIRKSDGSVGVKFHSAWSSWLLGGSFGIGSNNETYGGKFVLVMKTNTAYSPPATTDNVILYSYDVSSSAELFVKDESGIETQISPHDPNTGEWIFYSRNAKTGKVVRVDMERFFKKYGREFYHEWYEPVEMSKNVKLR